MRFCTCSLLSAAVTHHCCSTSETSKCATARTASTSSAVPSALSSDVARVPHSAPTDWPMVSRPPKFFFSRAFGLRLSGRPVCSSSGCSATIAVCTARVSGEHQSACAAMSERTAAASDGDDDSTLARAARTACCSRWACA